MTSEEKVKQIVGSLGAYAANITPESIDRMFNLAVDLKRALRKTQKEISENLTKGGTQ